jgi:GTP-binding protein
VFLDALAGVWSAQFIFLAEEDCRLKDLTKKSCNLTTFDFGEERNKIVMKRKPQLSACLLVGILSPSNYFYGGTAFTTRSLGVRKSVHMLVSVSETRLEVFDADREAAVQAKKELIQKRQQDQRQNQNQHPKDDQEWKFFDTARIHVSGGDGGNGCVAFRREKCEAMGGPNGGRGGNGGSVYLVCDETLNTLAPLRQRIHIMAIKGRNGLGKSRDGQKGRSIAIPVPPGTIIRELRTQKLAGELRQHGERILVARGGRGGRGNKAFMTERNTAPKLSERGEPGAKRWLSVELRLVADVGFLGKPNAGKSTLLAAASAARPKIANYPFTTIVPNLGVCDIGDEGAGLILCDIPGLIEGAAQGAGLGPAFLRHVQRCKVLLHVVDGTSEDPIGDFKTINKELKDYDSFLAEKPQVVVLNKIDVSEVQEIEDELLEELRKAAGHSRVLSISAATTANVKELMGRLKKFVESQPESELPPIPEINLALAGLDFDSDDYEIINDPSYPGQWRITGEYIENVAKMTHWEYPEAVARFGRQLNALGIAKELESRGARDGDLVMVGAYDFEFNPGLTNPYIPQELLEKDARMEAVRNGNVEDDEDGEVAWRPFNQGGFLDVDVDELVGFSESGDWEMLDDEFDEDFEFEEDDDVWTYSE